jgi:hypothetical protein
MTRKLALAAALTLTLALPTVAFAMDHDGWRGDHDGWRHDVGYGWRGGYGGFEGYDRYRSPCIKWSYTFDRWVNVCD